MLGVNLGIIFGNVGKEVKNVVLYKDTDREVYISNFSVCTNGFDRGKPTEEWHRIVVIGEMAKKIIVPYVKAGSPIFLIGETRTRPSTEINPATGKPATYYKELVVDYKGMIRLIPDGRGTKTPEPDGYNAEQAEAEAQYAALTGGFSQPQPSTKPKAQLVEPDDLDQRGAPAEQIEEQASMRQPTTQHKGRQRSQQAAQAAEEALAAGIAGEEVKTEEIPI